MKKTAELTSTALCAAIIALCAWITLPWAVPFTLQVLGIYFTLFFLGGKSGNLCILLYLVMGAVGIPVFSSFRGGLAHLVSPTGGFLWGFLAAGLIFWALKKVHPLVKAALGQLVCYGLGMAWYAFSVSSTLLTAFTLCVAPFVLLDAAKITAAYFLARKMKKLLAFS